MNRPFAAALTAATLLLTAAPPSAFAHCQVPCGIYGDQLKFEELNQHIETVAKAGVELNKLAGKSDAQSIQQIVRWTNNKESHAELIMVAMQSYFLAQRVKLPAENATDADKMAYMQKLAEIHAVIVHAMKVKQKADPKMAEGLKKALDTFQASYMGAHAGHQH